MWWSALCCTLLLSLFSFHVSSSPLTLYYTNTTSNSSTTLTIPALFATVGPLPTQPSQITNASVISHGACSYPNVEGHAIVFTLDVTQTMLFDCHFIDKRSSGIEICRSMQRSSASFVIIADDFKAFHGQAIGFTDTIKIPVVIITRKLMNNLFKSNEIVDLSIEFAAITSPERAEIRTLKRFWTGMISVTGIIYGVLGVLVVLASKDDVIKFVRNKYLLTPGLIMKFVTLYNVIATILWLAVDPFSFNGVTGWFSNIPRTTQVGASIIACLLTLLMWILAIEYNPMASKIIYVLCVLNFIIAFIYGLPFKPFHNTTTDVYSIFTIVVYALLAVCFCVAGRSIVKILLNAPENSQTSNRNFIIFKIVVFITYYIILVVSLIVLFAIGSLGPIFIQLFVMFFEGLGLLAAFVILFFHIFQNLGSAGNKRSVLLSSTPSV